VTRALELGPRGKIATALCLTSVGGFVDAVGYIALFEVFTANMSGNSVHVGISLGHQDWLELLRPFCAIVSYVVGMILTRITIGIAGRHGVRRIASFTLAVEAVLIALFAHATPKMHLGQIVDLTSPLYFTMVAWLAFAMGVQTATLNHFGALTIYTTFVTGTLTKFSESFTRALFWGYDKLRQSPASVVVRLARKQDDVCDSAFLASVWSCYVIGAALGSMLKARWQLRALYIPVVVLLVFIVVDQLRPIDVEEEKRQTGAA
jgi:uncharacterized membrane protein YoaK (UPF0700 family)